MSDLFETFVFDLQRFEDTATAKYGDIKTYQADTQTEGGEGEDADTYYWPESGQNLFLYDAAEGGTDYANEAVITFTYEEKAVNSTESGGEGNGEQDGKITTIKRIVSIQKVAPAQSTGESSTLVFSGAAINSQEATKETEGEEETDSITVNFYSASGELYFGMVPEAEEEEQTEEEGETTSAALPSSIHMSAGDKLFLDDDAKTSFNAENIYFGETKIADGFDPSEISSETAYLTFNASGEYSIEGLGAGDTVAVTDAVSATVETAAEDGGEVSVTADSEGKITVKCDKGGIITVDSPGGEATGVKGVDVTINDVVFNLGTTGFQYDNSGETPVLYLLDINFPSEDTEEEASSGGEGEDEETDPETETKKFVIGENTFFVAALSEEGSGFVLDSDNAATGFVFSASDTNVGIIVPEGVNDFKFYAPAAETEAENNTGEEIVEDDELPIPTVTNGGNYVVWKKTDDDQPVYSLIVPEGATVTDKTGGENAVTVTVTSLGSGEESETESATTKYVEIVFDEEDGTILGVMPTNKTVTETTDTETGEITKEVIEGDGEATFTAGTQIDVTGPDYTPGDTARNIYFGDAEKGMVALGTGDYTYGLDSAGAKYVQLAESTSDETVYYLDEAVKLLLNAGEGTITDNTDSPDEEASDTDPTYTFTNTSTSAYFTVKQEAASGTSESEEASGEHLLSGFVFGGKDDAIVRPAFSAEDTFKLAYLADGASVALDSTPQVDTQHTVTQVTDYEAADTPVEFAVNNFSESGAGVSFAGGKFIFGSTEDAFYFDSEGNALGFDGNDTVAMDEGAAGFLASGSFAINNEEVEINAVLAGESLIFDATETSLFGLSSGSQIVKAGVITKVYGTSGADNTLIVGNTEYTYSASGTTKDDLAFFTVDGDSATGFTFAVEGDALNVSASMVENGFGLSDAENGEIADIPKVYDSSDELKDEYKLTKAEDTNYLVSGFDEGDYTEIGEGTIAFETLTDGESASAAIKFDMTDGDVVGVENLVEGDAVRVTGVSTAIDLDGETVAIAGISIPNAVSYLLTKGSASSTLTEVWANVEITQVGTASYIGTAAGESGVGEYVFTQSGQSFGVYFDEDGSDSDVDGVKFVLGSDSKVTAIAGVHELEFVDGYESDFADVQTINGQSFAVTGASYIAVLGKADATAAGAVYLDGGEDVVVTATAGASVVDAVDVKQIKFGSGSAFTIEGQDAELTEDIQETDVEFYLNGMTVAGISDVDAQESISGYFGNVADVNGVSFDVQDKDDLTIVGNDGASGLTKIAGVGGGASILNVGGASEVITNEEGEFYFAGNSSTFTVTGDDEVTFQMVEGEDALVEGVNDFGDGGASATLSGELLGLTINNSSVSIVIDGDSDEVFDYMVDENGENATLGGVGNENGDVVTITETADAQFVQTSASGTFVFASGQSFTTDDDSLTFKLNENGEVTEIYGLDKDKHVTSSFAQSVAVEGEEDLQTVQIDNDPDVKIYYDALEIRDLSNLAIIGAAEGFSIAQTDVIGADETLVVVDAGGLSYAVTGGESFVRYMLDGQGNIVGVDKLAADATLRGPLGNLTEGINGTTFGVTETAAEFGGDGVFAVVGASNGIGAIVELGGEVTVTDAGGASIATTDDNAFITFADGNEFYVGGSGVKPEVDFALEDSNAVAIAGLSSNELVMGSGSAFEGIATVNDQNFAVTGASALAVVGNEDSTGLTGIAVFGGEDVVVSAAAGASFVDAANVDQITFGESSTFQIDGESKAVSFIIDEQLNVGSVSYVNAQESVTGDFTDVATVNGVSFAVVDDEVMVVGNENSDGLTKIAKVSDGAEIGNVGGASQVITDTEGEFFFAGNSTFTVTGDDEVTFQMAEGEDALVEGVDNFGDGGTSATLSGELLGLTINNSSASIVIDGDSDEVFDYMVDENGENATLGGVGNDDGDVVTITETADAQFVKTSASGTFVFASGQSFTTDDDSLTFQLNENGEVTAVYGLDDGKQISGNFSQSVAIYGEDGDNATIRVDGDDSITAYNDAIIITNLSNNATIAVAEDVTSATTDPMLLGTESIAITDADGHSYTVEGGVDEDGVTFLLDGHGHINGVSSLGEGIVLRGSFEGLSSVNGTTFGVTETATEYGGDGEFAIVGASDGISEIVNLGGSVAINDAGSATVAKTDDNAFITFADGNEFFVGGSGVKPEVDFALEDSNAVAIAGLSSNELVMGSGSAFEGIESVNGKDFAVMGASALAVVGNEGSSGLTGIAVFGGEDVVVSAAAGASFVDAADVDAITFGESSTFQIDGESKAVSFIIDEQLNVGAVSYVDSNESVTGDFTDVNTVNGVSFDVANDKEIMIVGKEPEDGITKIANVSDSAVINDVGGAAEVVTDTEGTFTFAGGNSFVVLGDSSVAFQMVDGAAASVAGITNFAVDGESVAMVIGKLNGLFINDKGTIDVEGADEILAYTAEQYEGETYYGLAVGGSAVTVNGAASATFIETTEDGKYTFAMDKAADPTTYTVGGDSEIVFEVEGNKVVGIYDMEKDASVTGDFSNVVSVEGIAADGTVEEEGTVQITGDPSVTVVYDEFEVRELSNGASISSATTFKHAYTDAATDALTVTDASGDEFTVENDADGVHYLLNGEGEIVGVDGLNEGATLSGSLGALSSVNGKAFDVKEEVLNTYGGLSAGDGKFAIVGGSNGIGSIVELGGRVTVTDGGGASKFATNDNVFITSGGDQYIVAALKEFSLEQLESITPSTVPAELIAQIAPYVIESDGVEFVTNGKDVIMAVNGLSGNELVATFAQSLPGGVGGDFPINGQNLNVKGNVQLIAAQGTNDEDGISALIVGGSSNVVVNKAAGAYGVLALDVDQIAFGSASAFTITSDKDIPGVGFGLSGLNVNRIALLDNKESVTGYFDDVAQVNGADFDVKDADEIMVVGNEKVDGLTKIANVSDSAIIANVAGASQVITDTNGTFTFTNSNQVFEVYELDKSTTFDMNGNDVANVNIDFGVVISDNAQFANVSVNGALVEIKGDEGDMAIGALSSDGIAIVANLGSTSGVVINNAGGASFIGTDKQGDFTFTNDGRAFNVAGDSQVVFVLDENENVVAVTGADKGASITGDFTKAVAFAGYSNASATEFTTATVQIANDPDVVVVHDDFEVRNLSNGASISSATTVYKAYTDAANLAPLTVTDASGDEFTVYGDADGVMYSLNGSGEIVAVEGLDENATLGGNLSELKAINGKDFDITETVVDGLGGNGVYSVVGGESAVGIGKVVGLGGLVFVNNAGGASELVTDDNIVIRGGNSFAKRIHISNDSDKVVTFGVSGTNDIVSVSDFAGTSSAVAIIDANLDGINGLTINDKGAVSVVGDGNDKVIFKDDGSGNATLTGIDNLNSSEGATIYSSAYADKIKTSGDGLYNFFDKQEFVVSGEGEGGNRSADSLTNAVWYDVDNDSVTAISSLNGAIAGDFTNAIKVNGEVIQIADADSLAVVYGTGSVDSAATNVSAIGEVDAAATVTTWGSASAISVRGNGDYVFIGADNATQTFTTGESDSITFVPNDSSVIGGVADFEDGTISFNPSETASLDVNIASVPGQTMTFASTQNVSLTVDSYEVVIVEGVTGSVSGLVGASTPATVVGVDGITSINVNGKDIFVDDDDDQFNVVVHDSTPDYLYDVDGDATVLAESVSVRANSAGTDTNPTKDTFVIGGESYIFDDSKDENDGFTFVTDSNGIMNKVASLEGALVINDGVWDGNINGDDFSVADSGTNSLPVTVNSGVSGIESVGGLEDGDSVAGDLGAAQVHIPGFDEPGGGDPATTITINGKPYTVVKDSNGVDVTGDNADVITDLDNQASLIGAEGEVTVNGTELEPEEGDVIKGDRANKSHARIVGDDELIRKATEIEHYNSGGYDSVNNTYARDPFNIEDIVGLPIYTNAEVFGSEASPLTKATTDYLQLIAGTSIAESLGIDFDQPMVAYIDNEDVKYEQVFDMSDYSYTKKVFMYGGPQAVKFNNEGGNLAVIAEGSDGVKNVSLGAGGDAVVMDEDYALQNAVYIYGGIGDDSVFVRHNANTYIDFSAGGDDILVTAGEANARVTIAGYQASTGAAIRVEEYLDVENEKAGTIAEGIENGIISFDEGIVRITTDEGRSEINVGTNGYGGQIVNLMTHVTSGNDYKQAVGFTGADGGIVDGSTYDSPLIMIGNKDNDKTAGSSLLGGTANDTFYGGADDFISTGYGNDYVSLFNDSLRGGAVVQIGDGRTTIDGMNNTLADSTGDVISVSIDPNDRTFSLTYDDELQIVEIESSADGYYAVLNDVDTLEGNYTTQYIYDEVGEELYSVAIGTVNSTIKVTEDEDLRPNVFFGYQTAIDFREYTGDAIIDLRGDMAESIIDETIVIIDDDITTLYAGIGDTALKGDLDDETFFAGKGNTWLYGDGGKNLLVGYTGSDKEGQTVFYVLGNEDGAANTIAGFNYVTDDNFTDTKKVTADALEFDLDDNQITRIDISGNDLVFEITDKAGNDTESALLLDAINEDGTGKDFIVSDNVAQVADNHLVFDQFADYYYAAGKNATVEVSGRIEDDVILWLDEDDTGKVFEGDIHVIDARNSDATAQLAGNENDNVIYAGTGETSLWGGEGGNDILVGNAGGRDTFYYSLGNGDDTITNVKDGDVIALDVSLDQIDEIDMSDATAIRIIMNDGDVLTINDAGHDLNVMIDNGEDGTDTYSTREARSRQ